MFWLISKGQDFSFEDTIINTKKNQLQVKLYHGIQHALSKLCPVAARAIDLADFLLCVAE